MKILFINNQIQLGGVETVIHQLRSGLSQAGHESLLYVAEGKTYPQDQGIVPLYPRLLSRLGHTRLNPVVQSLYPRREWTDRSFRRLAEAPGDLLHIHNFHGYYATTPSLAYLAARRHVVWTFHAFWGMTGGCDHPKECRRYQDKCGNCPQVGQWPVGPVDNTAEELQRKLQYLSDLPLHIIAPSKHLAAQVQESQVGRNWHMHHIPNGVEPAQFGFKRKHDPQFRLSLGLDPKATIILVVNRNFQDTQKGYGMVEEALNSLSPDHAADVQVVLAGRHSDWATARLPSYLRPVDLGYIGSRDTIANLYEASDIFLFASPAENFPCVILEAMSSQCCVVATPTSGVVEQIVHGNSGLLAERLTGDSLGRVLQEALAHPEKCRAYGEAARRRVESEFSERVMVERHIDLYQEIIVSPKANT